MTEINDYLDSVRHRLLHDEGFEPAEAELPFALQPCCAAFIRRQSVARDWYVALVPTVSLPTEQLQGALDQIQAHLDHNYLSGPPRHGIIVLVDEGAAPEISHVSLTVWRVDLAAGTVTRGAAPIGAPRLAALDCFDPVDWDAPAPVPLAPERPHEGGFGSAGDGRPPYRTGVGGSPWGRRPLPGRNLLQGPWVTNLMLAAIWAVFVLMMAQTGFMNILGDFSGQTLVRWGSQYSPAIVRGQWWRLTTAMFLHGSLMHIGFNSYALYVLGPSLENLYGHGRVLFVYLGAGIIASTASFLMGTSNAIGASGAVFGLMGAYLYYAWYVPGTARRRLWSGIWPTLLINLVIGVTVPFIDNWAHLGGLIGGFALSALAGLPDEKPVTIRRLAGVILLALFLLWAAPVLWHLWYLRDFFPAGS
ncbi:MAG: rhomboid family intramembrane serine protease [Symbiobacteriia bacterium]